MTAPPFDAIVSWIGDRLLVGSVEAIILLSLVWLACRRGNLSANTQATLWWLAALKIVIGLLPVPAVTLPLLPAPTPVQFTADDIAADRTTAETTATGPHPRTRETNAVNWNAIAVTVWLFVVIVHAVRLFGQHLHVRRLIRRSVPSGDQVGPLASAIGLRRIPAVHRSSDIDAPQVVGVMRPVILMPSAPLADSDRIMALSHELMHVRRRDLALGWIPAIAERLFFFHPLVRLAAREYHTAREAACDAAVVRARGIPASDYGRLLVRFGVASGQPAFVAGGASRSLSSLRRRLAMLQQSSSRTSRRIEWALSAVMLLAMIPIQLVAQEPSNRDVGRKADFKAAALVLQEPKEIEAILQAIEEHGSRDQAIREAFERRTRAEYEMLLNGTLQMDPAASQQEFTAKQLDGVRRTIEQMANQLEELRKMEQRLREQLDRK